MDDALAFWDLVWERLLARDSMVPDMPGWRDEWAPDRRSLVFLFEVGDLAEVVDVATRVGEALETVGVRPIAPESLHLTIRSVGFVDELVDDPNAVIEQAAHALEGTRAASVKIVGAGSFDDTAILQVAPWDSLRAIQQPLLAHVPALSPSWAEAERRAAEGGFAPHISVAYYEQPIPSSDIARALQPFRRMDGPVFVIDAISLVSVPPPVEPFFTWDIIARFPLRRT